MNPIEIKVARIGNSRGVRIPAGTLERYRIGATVLMEERGDGSCSVLSAPPIQSSHGKKPRARWRPKARIGAPGRQRLPTAWIAFRHREPRRAERAAASRHRVSAHEPASSSKSRLGRKLGSLPSDEARGLRRLITEMYGE